MKILNHLAVLSSIFFFQSLSHAVNVPAGIKHEGYDRLLKKYVDENGLVAYGKWKNNAADVKVLDAYLEQFAPAGNSAGADEKFSSLINAYNAFVLQLVLQNYPTESIWSVKNSFKTRSHKLGGEMVSLNDIENLTLRPEFGYRTHAVLVCAGRSCPPLQRSAYTSDQLDEQVTRAYKQWLGRADLNEFLPAKNEVSVSSIFKWFKGDFEKVGGVPKILAKYAPAQDRNFLEHPGYKITYKDYNWGLNDQGEHGRHYSKTNLYLDNIF